MSPRRALAPAGVFIASAPLGLRPRPQRCRHCLRHRRLGFCRLPREDAAEGYALGWLLALARCGAAPAGYARESYIEPSFLITLAAVVARRLGPRWGRRRRAVARLSLPRRGGPAPLLMGSGGPRPLVASAPRWRSARSGALAAAAHRLSRFALPFIFRLTHHAAPAAWVSIGSDADTSPNVMISTRCVLRSSHWTMLLSLATASEQPDRDSAARRARRHCRGRLRLRLRWPLLAARAGLALRRRYAPPCPPLGSLRSPPRGSSWPVGWLRSACSFIYL